MKLKTGYSTQVRNTKNIQIVKRGRRLVYIGIIYDVQNF